MSIVAVLAPTNTGKTHRAVERMLESRTGMIGLPLRLLAREVYDRVTARIGEAEVALVTGEEKRVPKAPRYWICTVESMPVSHPVDFLAVDEIQLAAHHQRGHVFTDRLLNARGRKETWFLGADTMRPLIRTLLPEVDVQRHARLSQLRHVGAQSLRSLPPRSAVVDFSATRVYELAERLRERRGGVAVVLGALSPRTRNAQVAMYQSGEVQYMVATDAIGMGLNMDVDHVAFGALRKFDGRDERPLEPDELAQIAGRAGRFHADGTFGTLSSVPALPQRVSRAIEQHRFPAVQRLVWRNSDLDMRTIDGLLRSLSRRPGHSALNLVAHAEDFHALSRLSADADVRARAQGAEAVSLLWQVCQIPDFRKLLEESHVRLLTEIFAQLSGPDGRIDPRWMNRRIARLDDIDGDIDTLMTRIAFVRTWTYVSHHTQWVRDVDYWRERTRAIEDRLSDALHARLVHRFVAKRRRQAARSVVRAESPFSKLRDLLPEHRNEFDIWLEALSSANHEQLSVDARGWISFRDVVIGRMTPGPDMLQPEVVVSMSDLGAGARTRIGRRLIAWTKDLVAEALSPLRRERAQTLSPAGRGLVYQLERGLGTVYRRQARGQVRELNDRDRAILRELDVRLGRSLIYVHSLLSPRAVERRLVLCAQTMPVGVTLRGPRPGAVSMLVQDGVHHTVYRMLGYPVFGPCAIRADMAERVYRALSDAARGRRQFEAPVEIASWLGCKRELVTDIVVGFGYRALDDGLFIAPNRRRRNRRR